MLHWENRRAAAPPDTGSKPAWETSGRPTGFRGKWRKWIPSFRLQQNKVKLCQGTQWRPQGHPERRNPGNNHWEFHGAITRHGQPKCTRGTKKFQDTKNKEYEKTQKQINELVGALNKHQSETENTIER
jgi:hypothetical protein